MYLLVERHRHAPLSVARRGYHVIGSVGRILRPCHVVAAHRRRIQHVATALDRLCRRALGQQIDIAQPRRHLLLEERAAPVFGPPHHARRRERRPRRERTRARQTALGPGQRIYHYQLRGRVEILFKGDHAPVVAHLRPRIYRMAPRLGHGQRHGRLLDVGACLPVGHKLVERILQQAETGAAEEFFQHPVRRDYHIRTTRGKPCYAVAHDLAVTRVTAAAYQVTEAVMVGDIIPERAAEPLVLVGKAPQDIAVGAIGHRETRLQAAAECRHLGLRHYRIALDHPQRHEYEAYGRTLLPEQIAQDLHHAAVEVVVLHGMTVLVRHELLLPRHGVARDGGRREKLYSLGQPHYKAVRTKIHRMYDQRDRHLPVAVTERYVAADGIHIVHRPARYALGRIGIYDAVVLAAKRPPRQRGGIGAPTVILSVGTLLHAHGAQHGT